MRSKMKRIGLISAIIITGIFIIISAFAVIFKPRIIPVKEIVNTFWGDNVVTEKNIPYAYTGKAINDTYAIVIPKYYKLPKISDSYDNIEDLFSAMTKLPYSRAQLDPAKLWDFGGECQSFSIYLRTALTKWGYNAGYFNTFNHVFVWVFLDNEPYKIDIVTKEFSKMPRTDSERLKKLLGDNKWKEYSGE